MLYYDSTGCSARLARFDVTKHVWTLLVLTLFCIHAMEEKEIRFVKQNYRKIVKIFNHFSFFSSGPIEPIRNSFITNLPIAAWPLAATTKSSSWKIAMLIERLKSGSLKTMTPPS